MKDSNYYYKFALVCSGLAIIISSIGIVFSVFIGHIVMMPVYIALIIFNIYWSRRTIKDRANSNEK